MLLEFNIDKAIAATAYIIERDGGKSDMFPLIKKLYYADRSALIGWGNSVTGDSLASLPKGPIVSSIYNLLKGEGHAADQIRWDEFIERERNSIAVRKEVETGILSQREKEILDSARLKINSIRGSIPDWMHKNCPEWENPGRSSAPIDPSTILRLANISEEQIHSLEETNEELRFINSLLSAR